MKLGYTQSAISQQIATLERIVGEQLIERPGGPRPVALTEAGRLLLRHARAIVARLQAAQADLAALSAGEAGSLHVGIFQSVGARILPEVMRRFAQAWPNVEVELRESHDDSELADLVERGAPRPLLRPAPARQPVARDAAAPERRLRARQRRRARTSRAPGRIPTLREIAEQPLIGFRNCRATELVVEQIRAPGASPTSCSAPTRTASSRASPAPGSASRSSRASPSTRTTTTVRITNLSPRLAQRQVGIARHKDRYHSPAAQAFVATALEVGAETATELAA